MKWFLLMTVILGAVSAQAQSQRSLQVSGRVAEKVSVQIEKGEVKVIKNSPHLKVVVEKRKPASLVRVEAP